MRLVRESVAESTEPGRREAQGPRRPVGLAEQWIRAHVLVCRKALRKRQLGQLAIQNPALDTRVLAVHSHSG